MDTRGSPGKCVPRFIEDLLRYDPSNPAATGGRNVLIEPPTKLGDGGVLPISIGDGACRHNYMVKPDQSVLPSLESRPDSTSCYRIASFCADCRCHLTLMVDFRSGHSELLCPNEQYPLHHLRYDPDGSEYRTESAEDQQWKERHRFVCSSPGCSVLVGISIRPPRLGAPHLSLLTDPAKIKARAKQAIDNSPERLKDQAVPEPIVVLQYLRQYVNNALRQTHTHFSANNKKFKTSLGEPCRPLLEYLGFRFEVDLEQVCDLLAFTIPMDEGVTRTKGSKWYMPRISQSTDGPLLQDPLSVLVDDVEKELMVLMHSRPVAEKAKANLNVTFYPRPSKIEFERCLGSVDYPKIPSARRVIDLTADEDPYFVGLGAVEDFSDELVVYAYERQKDCDPDHAPFYLSWLQEIAGRRGSELLQTKVALMESSGEISYRDINHAYQYFQANPTWDDATIIGAFRSRLEDAPRQEAEARQHLRAIGVVRQSEIIQSTALNRVATYHEALAWLGAEESTTDEFVITLFTMKVSENKAETELGREAVRLVAEKRNSDALRNWLSTGQLGEFELDENQAYARLGIEDRSLDDDTILTTFDIRVSESPSQADEIRAALKAIGKARQSQRLGWFLQTATAPQNASSDWPVGLENIGNTCYLNSLLQYYFSVKPLRHVIEHFEEVEMPMDTANIEEKQVGSRRVSLKEVERAKKFVYELRKLFLTLKSAQTSSIAPERELARLTLIKSSDEEDYRRRSIAGSQGRPNLGEINGVPVQGPALPQEISTSMDVDTSTQGVQPHEYNSSGGSSDATLVEKQLLNETADAIMRDAQTSDSNADGMQQHFDQAVVDLGNEMSDDKENQCEASDTVMTNGIIPANSEDNEHPPDRPPPVPPRPKPVETTQKPMDELELGAQQDVTEVIGNVLFQLECAIRPMYIDSSGEQYDEVKEIFYGKLRTYIELEGELRRAEQYFSDIKVDVAAGPRDIYDALDGAFDAQEVTMKDGRFMQYTSISRLPRILQIQIQRVQFDVKNKKTYKSDAHLRLREKIYLDRYMVSRRDPVILEKRKETWRWKDELRKLEEKKMRLLQTEAGMSVPEVLDLTNNWLEESRSTNIDGIIGGDANTFVTLKERAEEAKKELEEIDSSMRNLRSKLENQFNDHQKHGYRLAAVFIHRGTATFGHYWIYIYDFGRKIWRKYNDSYVTEVTDEKEIFGDYDDQQQQTSGWNRPATPYFLVYVEEGWEEEVFEPVCRDLTINTSTENPNPNEEMDWDNGDANNDGEMVVEMQERRDDAEGGGIGGLPGEKLIGYSAATGAGQSPSQTNYYVDDDPENQKFNEEGW